MKPEDWVKFRGLLQNASISELNYMQKLLNNEIKWSIEEEELIGITN